MKPPWDVRLTGLTEMGAVASAWIFDAAPGVCVAVAGGCIVELLEHPTFTPVPRMAPHALGLTLWRGKYCAAIDLGRLARHAVPMASPPLAAVAAYPARDGSLAYGVIGLRSPPTMLFVHATDECAIPEEHRFPRDYAVSWLIHKDLPVPVLSVRKLFGPRPDA